MRKLIKTGLCNKQVSPKENAVLSINKLQIILVYNTTSNVYASCVSNVRYGLYIL